MSHGSFTQSLPEASAQSPEVFIARQPIFDSRQHTVGYELLFRSGASDCYDAADPTAASLQALNNALNLIGLETLTGGRKAFVNFTRDLLLEHAFMLMPPDLGVIEVLETVPPDGPVVDACRAAREAGYTIALDDFVFDARYEELLHLADIVKIDCLDNPEAGHQQWARAASHSGVSLLAEKIETHQAFDAAQQAGYTYFQGYFFSRPELCAGHDLPSHHGIHLQFLAALHQPTLCYDALERIIKQDTALCYKLLGYLNSAALGVRQRVGSVKQGLALLGERAVRKWGSLVALTALADHQPSELITSCLIRARFCEQLAGYLNQAQRRDAFFMTGLFSRLNVVVRQPLHEVLRHVAIEEQIKQALLGEPCELHDAYTLAGRCEHGDWDRVHALAAELRVPTREVARLHREAICWSDRLLSDLSPAG